MHLHTHCEMYTLNMKVGVSMFNIRIHFPPILPISCSIFYNPEMALNPS